VDNFREDDMVTLMRKTSIGALIGIAALFGACSSDSADAPTGIDAGGSNIDAGAATSFGPLTMTKAAEVAAGNTCADAVNPTATAMVTISGDNKSITATVTYTAATFSGALTGAHIHFGAATVAGGIALDFGSTLTSPISKTFTSTDYKNPSGGPATFDAFVTAMKGGMTYVNVHTSKCGGGEARAQIQ
jgi:hypothetical protein